jgi:hypothetical protein
MSTATALPVPADDDVTPIPSVWLFRRIGFTSLDEAIERFRAFTKAHPDLEPNLTCERNRQGHRHWVLDVRLRDNPRRPKEEEEEST